MFHCERCRLTSGFLCVIMLDMKTATVRQVQHHLSHILRLVDDGQEVLITKRSRVIAKIVPAKDGSPGVKWPDFIRRATEIWGKRARGKAVSRIIIEERKERS